MPPRKNKGRQARRTESLTPRSTEQTATSPPPGFRASHGQTNAAQLQRSVSQQAGSPWQDTGLKSTEQLKLHAA